VATLAFGLAADVRTGILGQLAISAVFWAEFLWLCRLAEPRERASLVACLAVSTAGELFLSLAWGLYTYRLGNVPLFVPPGHVMMYLLAFPLARRLTPSASILRARNARFGGPAVAIAWIAALYAIVAAFLGVDTLALLLLAGLAVMMFAMPAERPLLIATLLACLALELYGTGLGVWTWGRDVPYLGLTTTNPPALSGAFYGVRDALTVAIVAALARTTVPTLAAPQPVP
jgi:hypothetical protein